MSQISKAPYAKIQAVSCIGSNSKKFYLEEEEEQQQQQDL